MKRALAIQMLAVARENLANVDARAETLQRLVFDYEDDEHLGRDMTWHVDRVFDAALAIRRQTERLDTEQPGEHDDRTEP
jgi:hypothetical protein